MWKLPSAVKAVRHHVESFHSRVPTYNGRFKDDIRECFANFPERVQEATRNLVNMSRLGLAKMVDVNFNVVHDILQTSETKISHFEPVMNLLE